MSKKSRLKLPPISKGNKRAFVKCRDCGKPAYYDYLPYSLSNPIMTMPCGHGLTERFHRTALPITKEEFLRLSRI